MTPAHRTLLASAMLARASGPRPALGREPLMEALVAGVRAAIPERRGRLEVLAGPAGSGRSHLLSTARARLCGCSGAVEVWLPEDAPTGSLLHLLSLVLEGLPEAPERGEAERPGAQLRRGRGKASVERALRLLDRHLAGQVLLLYVDGLDALLEGLGGKEQRRLSQLLTTRAWVVVATGSGATGALGAHTAAFDTGIHVRRLPPLSDEDARTLLRCRARERGRLALADFLESKAGREAVRLWHRVLGGHPASLIELEPFLAAEHDPWTTLAALAEHTRSAQASGVGRLSPGQRTVLACLGRHARPLTVGELAARSFNSHQTTSSHLRYLSKAGHVQALTMGRERFYEVRDPMLRECWAARRRAERQRAVLGVIEVECAVAGPVLPTLSLRWAATPGLLAMEAPQRGGKDALAAALLLESCVLGGVDADAADRGRARRACTTALETEDGARCARALMLDGASPASVLTRAGEVLFAHATAPLLQELLPVLLDRGAMRETVALGDRVAWAELGARDRLAWVQAACRTGDQRRAAGRVVDIVETVEDTCARRWMLAAGYLAVGEHTAALREAELGRDASPGQLVFSRLAAQAAWALRDLDRAARHAEAVVRGSGEAAEDWLLLGAISSGLGRHRRAVLALERVVDDPVHGVLGRQLLFPELIRVGSTERARGLVSGMEGPVAMLAADLLDLLEGGAGRGLGSRPPRPEALSAPVAARWYDSWLQAMLGRWRDAPSVAMAELAVAFSGPFHASWAAWWGWMMATNAAGEGETRALDGVLAWLEQVLELPEEVQLPRALMALPRDARPFARLSSLERRLARRLLAEAGAQGRARLAKLPQEKRSGSTL